MKAVIFAMALSASIAQHSVYAHTSHGIDEDTAAATVYKMVPQLTTKDFGYEVGQLNESWNSIAESDVSMVETDGDFYVMQAVHPKSKAVIFFLIGINGQVLEVKENNSF